MRERTVRVSVPESLSSGSSAGIIPDDDFGIGLAVKVVIQPLGVHVFGRQAALYPDTAAAALHSQPAFTCIIIHV